MIYFIRDKRDGQIKIGLSKDPWARLSALAIGASGSLSLLAVMDGDRKRELELHKRFKAHRIAGEWFKSAPDLLAFIDKAKAEHPQTRVTVEKAEMPPMSTLDPDDELMRQMANPIFWARLDAIQQRMMALRGEFAVPDIIAELLQTVDIDAELASIRTRLAFLERLDRCRKAYFPELSDASQVDSGDPRGSETVAGAVKRAAE